MGFLLAPLWLLWTTKNIHELLVRLLEVVSLFSLFWLLSLCWLLNLLEDLLSETLHVVALRVGVPSPGMPCAQ